MCSITRERRRDLHKILLLRTFSTEQYQLIDTFLNLVQENAQLKVRRPYFAKRIFVEYASQLIVKLERSAQEEFSADNEFARALSLLYEPRDRELKERLILEYFQDASSLDPNNELDHLISIFLNQLKSEGPHCFVRYLRANYLDILSCLFESQGEFKSSLALGLIRWVADDELKNSNVDSITPHQEEILATIISNFRNLDSMAKETLVSVMNSTSKSKILLASPLVAESWAPFAMLEIGTKMGRRQSTLNSRLLKAT